MYKEIMHAINKYLELKKLVGLPPNSNYLLSSVASQDTTTCQNNATTYRNARANTVSIRYGHTDTLCINFPFFELSSFRVIPVNLASHARYTA